MPPKTLDIGVFLDARDARAEAIRDGLAALARQRPDVRIDLFDPTHNYSMDLLGGCEAFVVGATENGANLSNLLQAGVPLVLMDYVATELDLPRAGLNDVAIGHMGGELLLSLNVESIGYFGGVMDPDHARCQGLSQAADDEGKQVSHFSTWLDMHDPVDYVRTRDIKLVGPWLEHLDFPAGVLCLNDETARRLVHACELLGVHVPEQVAVLGIDNSHLCEFSRPQISSVDVNADRLGFEAARMATELIETGRCDPHQVLIEPRAVIHRESTGVLHSPDPVVSRAARYTIQHMEQSITAVDIAEAVGVGRSTLDRLFRRQGLPAPAGMLRKLRLDRAKQMLETTDLPLADVAVRCGFNYLSHFSRAFKAEFGQSPSVYRDGA